MSSIAAILWLKQANCASFASEVGVFETLFEVLVAGEVVAPAAIFLPTIVGAFLLAARLNLEVPAALATADAIRIFGHPHDLEVVEIVAEAAASFAASAVLLIVAEILAACPTDPSPREERDGRIAAVMVQPDVAATPVEGQKADFPDLI